MGNKELNLAEPITNKIFKNYENDKIRVGICLMQGWRKTMEDISLALPNFDDQNSLFGVFDGHGGSIVSQFAACNIDELIKNSKSYQKSNYEQSLIDSFVILDELLKNGRINRFLKKIKNFQKNTKNVHGNNNSIINNELLKGNTKNDPNNDYLFFCSSYLDNEINLKYKYPDLQHCINLKNNNIKKHFTEAINININNNEFEHNASSPHLNFFAKRCNSVKKSSSKKLKTHDDYLKKIKHSFIYNHIENENILEAEDITKSNTKSKLEKSASFKYNDESYTPSLIANDIGTTANVLLLKKNWGGENMTVFQIKWNT